MIGRFRALLPRGRRGSMLSHAAIYGLANAVNHLLPLLLLPVLTRVLSVEEFGLIATFSAILAFAVPLIGLNAHGAVQVAYYDRDAAGFKGVVSAAVAIMTGTLLVALCLLLLFGGVLAEWVVFPQSWLYAVPIAAAAQFLVTIQLTIWQAEGRPGVYGAVSIAMAALNLGLSLVLILAFDLGWQGRIVAAVISTVVMALFSVGVLRGRRTFSRRVQPSDVKSTLVFGVPLLAHIWGMVLIAYANRFFLNRMVGLEATGIFTVAFYLAQIVNMLQTSFNLAWMPFLFESLRARETAKLVRYTYASFAALLAIALVVSLAGPIVIPIVAGDSYRSAAALLPWLAFAYAANGMYKMLAGYLYFGKRTVLLGAITLTAALMAIPTTYFLIMANGAVGAAQAMLIAFGTSFLLTWYFAQKEFPMPWAWGRDTREIGGR